MLTKKTATKTTPKKKVAKKVVKKSTKKVAKKAASKTAKKTSTKKTLVYADNSASFWVSTGQILNSLVALRDALDTMEKQAYLYHAKGEHNDFANWVEVVLCDEDCAKALRRAKTPTAAKTAVVKHLKHYSL
jgi:hypothetical protein